jgi:hypothetical protein
MLGGDGTRRCNKNLAVMKAEGVEMRIWCTRGGESSAYFGSVGVEIMDARGRT